MTERREQSPELQLCRRELESSLQALSGTLAPLAAQSAELIDRLRPIVTAETARLRERLDRIDGDPSQQWPLLVALAADVQRLAAEALAFVGGVAARAAGLDGGLCDMADRLIDDTARQLLVDYHAITLPAAGEYIDVLSEVIRVRYPGSRIWDLPFALHELGHFLVTRFHPAAGARQARAPDTAGQTPANDTPARIIEREQIVGERVVPYRGAFAEELWADTFATYVCGPAYALAALTRFDPATANSHRKPTHPAAAMRAGAIFATLERSQEAWQRSAKAAGSLQPLIALATRVWQARLCAVGTDACAVGADAQADAQPAAELRQEGERLAVEFVDLLDRQSVASRYTNARAAGFVRGWLVDGGEPPTQSALLDMLNGAWWARCAPPQDGAPVAIDQIEDAACTICANIQHRG
ncbi:MAG TPA: hypothetical protein VNV42_03030 [Solirubrobacteraceae bacterium]|nr:hypothetical protein [Solirubrobacteraceae bacterium]